MAYKADPPKVVKYPFLRFAFLLKWPIISHWDHLLTEYEELPKAPTSYEILVGNITSEQLDICINIYDETMETKNALEAKASSLLTIHSFLIPLVISGFAYVSLDRDKELFEIVTFILITFFTSLTLLLSLRGALKALSIKKVTAMFTDAIIDENTNKIKTCNKDDLGKGYLYCASINAASNCHLADYVKASQYFLTVALFVFLFGGFLTIGLMGHRSNNQQETQIKIEGKMAAIAHSTFTANRNLSTISQELTAIKKQVEAINVNITNRDERSRKKKPIAEKQ